MHGCSAGSLRRSNHHCADGMKYRLRDAEIEDVDALAELHVRTFQETHGGGPSVAVRKTQWAAGAERLYSTGGEFHGAYGWRDLRALVSTHCGRVE